jgi:hypothetical protein
MDAERKIRQKVVERRAVFNQIIELGSAIRSRAQEPRRR